MTRREGVGAQMRGTSLGVGGVGGQKRRESKAASQERMELGGPAVLFAWDCPGGNVESPGCWEAPHNGGSRSLRQGNQGILCDWSGEKGLGPEWPGRCFKQ